MWYFIRCSTSGKISNFDCLVWIWFYIIWFYTHMVTWLEIDLERRRKLFPALFYHSDVFSSSHKNNCTKKYVWSTSDSFESYREKCEFVKTRPKLRLKGAFHENSRWKRRKKLRSGHVKMRLLCRRMGELLSSRWNGYKLPIRSRKIRFILANSIRRHFDTAHMYFCTFE